MTLKNPVTPPGIDPGSVQLVAQALTTTLPQAPLTEMSTRNISWEKRRLMRKADNLTTFMSQLSANLEARDSWNLQVRFT
jgi:hypothetical protein